MIEITIIIVCRLANWMMEIVHIGQQNDDKNGYSQIKIEL